MPCGVFGVAVRGLDWLDHGDTLNAVNDAELREALSGANHDKAIIDSLRIVGVWKVGTT